MSNPDGVNFTYTSQGKTYVVVSGPEKQPDGTIKITPIVTEEISHQNEPSGNKQTQSETPAQKTQKPHKRIPTVFVKSDWSGEPYVKLNAGATTVFNFGEGKREQSGSFSSDALFGIKITENRTENTGFFFDANAGLKYDTSVVPSPNRHRGGPTGEITIGYKMPIYEDRTTNITWDNYATGYASYCSDGDNRFGDAFAHEYSASSSKNNFNMHASQIDRYNMDVNPYSNGLYGGTPVSYDVKQFNGEIKSYSLEGYRKGIVDDIKKRNPELTEEQLSASGIVDNAQTTPNLDTYELKAGVGTGFTFNFNTDYDKENDLSLYIGAEGGYHKIGPEFTAKTKVSEIYGKDEMTKSEIGIVEDSTQVVEYHKPDYHKPWYLTPKIGLNYKFNGANTKEISLTADTHGVYIGGRFAINTFDINTPHRKHKKH